MSVFTAPVPTVDLPIASGHNEPNGTVHWVVILDVYDSDPWVVPCDGCTVIENDVCRQEGCDACRGRGWFSETTGLPVKVWWWQPNRAASANWLVHSVVPRMLEAVGYTDDAEKVRNLPEITTERLSKRNAGVGLLETITERVAADARARLERGDHGGWVMTADWADRSHGVWRPAVEAKLDFRLSRLGYWAYYLANEVANLMRARRDQGDLGLNLDGLLDSLLQDHEREASGAYMLEEDVVLGPERPRLHGGGGTRCESRFEVAGVLHQCEVVDPPRADAHHRASTEPGEVRWFDEQNVQVQCTSTLTTAEGFTEMTSLRCGDRLYGHHSKRDGTLEHHWEGPAPADPDDYPDMRFWSDEAAAAIPLPAHS